MAIVTIHKHLAKVMLVVMVTASKPHIRVPAAMLADLAAAEIPDHNPDHNLDHYQVTRVPLMAAENFSITLPVCQQTR